MTWVDRGHVCVLVPGTRLCSLSAVATDRTTWPDNPEWSERPKRLPRRSTELLLLGRPGHSLPAADPRPLRLPVPCPTPDGTDTMTAGRLHPERQPGLRLGRSSTELLSDRGCPWCGGGWCPCALFSPPPEPRRVSPGEYPEWEQALALLNRDLTVTFPSWNPCNCWPFRPMTQVSRRTSTSPWPTASGTATTWTRTHRTALRLHWRASPMPRRRPSWSFCGRRGPCAPSTAWACIQGRTQKSDSPGGARERGCVPARLMSTGPWAHSRDRSGTRGARPNPTTKRLARIRHETADHHGQQKARVAPALGWAGGFRLDHRADHRKMPAMWSPARQMVAVSS